MQWVLLWTCILLLLFVPVVQVILSQSTLLHTHRQLTDFLGEVPSDLNLEEISALLLASGFDERLVRLRSIGGGAYLLEYVCPLTKRRRDLRVQDVE